MYHMEETIQQPGKLGIYSLQDLTVDSVFMLTKCQGHVVVMIPIFHFL